jgi:hypothetical protein
MTTRPTQGALHATRERREVARFPRTRLGLGLRPPSRGGGARTEIPRGGDTDGS